MEYYYGPQSGSQIEGRSEDIVSQSVSQPSEEYSFEDTSQPLMTENLAAQMSMEEASALGEQRGRQRRAGEEEDGAGGEEEEEEEDTVGYSEEDLEERTEAVWVVLNENDRGVGEGGRSNV